MSAGVQWTSVRLSGAVRSFLVDFQCWFGDSPADSLLESPSDSMESRTVKPRNHLVAVDADDGHH